MILTAVVKEKEDLEKELNQKLIELQQQDCEIQNVKITMGQNDKATALIVYDFQRKLTGTMEKIMADIDVAINGIV